MAKFILPQSKGWSPLSEGTKILKIVEIEYDEDFQIMTVKFETATKQSHIEKYRFLKKDKTQNNGALNSFAFMARTALQDYSIEGAFDYTRLVGRYISCEVYHTSSGLAENGEPGTPYVHFKNIQKVNGFASETVAEPKQEPSLYDVLDDIF